MEEYEIIKTENINHFEKWRETVKELKYNRLVERYKDRQIAKKMNWARKLKIQRLSEGNPFSDRIVNHSLLRNMND